MEETVMVALPEYALSVTNGCVPDTTGPLVQQWPKASGQTERDESSKISVASVDNCIRLPQIVLYEHIDFGGVSTETALSWFFVGDFWNDRISSIVVLGGRWRLYEHWHYEGRYWDLGPGYYRWVQDSGIPNDTISSFQLVSFC
jgi:hypothetical protein